MNQSIEPNAATPVPVPQHHAASAPTGAYARLKDRLDLLVAICALITSVTSIWLSISQGDDMARLVQAQSWPHIGFSTGNADWNEVNARWDDRLVLALENVGVGPAKIRSVKMRYEGRSIASSDALLAACCGYQETTRLSTHEAPLVTSSVVGIVLRAGQKVELLNWQRPESTEAPESKERVEASKKVWRALDDSRGRIQLEVCYCSVFDECWTLMPNAETVPTASCPTDRGSFYLQ